MQAPERRVGHEWRRVCYACICVELRWQRDFSESTLRELTRRVYSLERGERPVVPEPMVEQVPDVPPVVETAPAEHVPVAEGPIAEIPAEPAYAGPTLAETISARFKGQQWESVVHPCVSL